MNKRYRDLLFLASIVTLLFSLMVFAVYRDLRLTARNLAELSLHSIADRRIASTIYYETVSRPKLLEALKASNADDRFDPSLLSGTYISRSKQEIYDFVSGGGYKVRNFAVNARTLQNEASDRERLFLDEINSDRDIIFRTHEEVIDGEPHLILLHRDSVQEESCLECHGAPEDAHEDIIRLYGDSKGFNRKVGEIVSGLAVSVSLKPFYNEAHTRAFKLSLRLAAGLSALLFSCYWFAARSRRQKDEASRADRHP